MPLEIQKSPNDSKQYRFVSLWVLLILMYKCSLCSLYLVFTGYAYANIT